MKNILWDFDNVFLHNNFKFWKYFIAAEKIASSCNINISAEEIENRWLASQKTETPYEMSIDVLVHEFGASYLLAHSMMHDVLIAEHHQKFTVNKNLLENILRIDEHQNIIVTHSNNVWIKFWLKQMNLEDFFDGVFCVKNQGLCKHSIAHTYDVVLKKYELNSNTTFMVDDSERNLLFAQQSGITPILFAEKQSKNGYQHFSCPISLIDYLAS
jgi:FMN phosphatase YigB (HAD superfamily)